MRVCLKIGMLLTKMMIRHGIRVMAAPPLRAFLATHPIRGRVLVPGCGLGHDVRLLAEQGASVVGLDIVPKAVRQAQADYAVGDERFEVADFLNLPDRYPWAI